jgi:hypothetical protein
MEPKTHAYWLSSAQLWLAEPLTFPQENEMLFDLLKREAERQHEREPQITALDHLHRIMDELGLTLVKR